MNLEFIANFIQTADHRSIAKASEALNLTHPALGKQIRKLESYYGVTLFYRSAAGVQLTEAGRVLYERLSRVLGELSSIRSEMATFSVHAGMTTVLKVGTLPSLAAYYMPHKMVEMERKGIRLNVSVQNTSELLLQDVAAGELDAAMIDDNKTSHMVWSRKLFHEPYYIIVPDNHRFCAETSVSIRDLAAELFVMYPKACSIRKWVNDMFHKQRLDSVRIQTEIPFGDYIPGYVAAGAGIAVVPQMTAQHLGHPTLKAIPIADPEAGRTITLIAAAETVGKQLYSHVRT
ncbi:LysR family transcriptional regulator [Paenibacillus allorhizosphaerae]|uniref:Hydrogen peroxide-inducible genes activator n=1 Tax=Paenibacillus allorhizosphaerae TaxID=2849866 RepID=A0ABN7TK67_9BACL|nr:LysR family transcriptional regulator [Paenibacillus allorhizosphaerae]CAG7642786.1 Hydrogen peroxide-inducible genes activator [Paenibacillus allorhizosphaerae]